MRVPGTRRERLEIRRLEVEANLVFNAAHLFFIVTDGLLAASYRHVDSAPNLAGGRGKAYSFERGITSHAHGCAIIAEFNRAGGHDCLTLPLLSLFFSYYILFNIFAIISSLLLTRSRNSDPRSRVQFLPNLHDVRFVPCILHREKT